MYWPLGTPRIFSAKVTNLVTTYDSDDNPETGTQVPVDNDEDSSSKFYSDHPLLDDGPGFEEEGSVNSLRKDGPNISSTYSLRTPLRIPRDNASEESKISRSNLEVIFSKETNEQLASGALLALRMSRNGALFATLSVCEMTIWQIKVRRTRQGGP